MPGPYIFKQIFAADPFNTANVATNASILLFAPGDPAMTPLVITDASTGLTLANPVQTNTNGFGPTFAHATLDQVAWEGGGFKGTFESWRGLKDDAEASATSAATSALAAETAAEEAATAVQEALAGAVGEAEAAKVAAQAAAGLVGAPAGAAVLAAIQPGGAAHGELSAAIGDQLAGAIKTKGNPTAVIFGTSLEAQNGTGAQVKDPPNGPAGLSGRGWVNWMNAYLGQRFAVIRNAGVGGNTFAQMKARIATDVLAYPSDWVFIGGPANDIIQNRTAAATIADLDFIHDTLIADGRRVLQLTTPPVQALTASQKSVLDTVNTHIKAINGKRGVIVSDSYPITANEQTYEPRTGMVVDTIHYTEQAAHRIGRNAAADLAAAYPVVPFGILADMDTKSIIANPAMTSGTGWIVDQAGGIATATYPGGGHAYMNIVGSGAAPSAGASIYYEQNISGGTFAVGDVVQLSARIKWSALKPLAIAAGCRPYTRIAQRNTTGAFGPEAVAFSVAGSDSRIQTELPETGEVVAITYPITLMTDVLRIYAYVGWWGAAAVVLDISDIQISKF